MGDSPKSFFLTPALNPLLWFKFIFIICVINIKTILQPIANIVGLANFAAVSLVEEVVGTIVGQEGVGFRAYLQIWSVPLNVYFNKHFIHYI